MKMSGQEQTNLGAGVDKSDQEVVTGSERTGVMVGLSAAGSTHHLDLSQVAASLNYWTAVRISNTNFRSELVEITFVTRGEREVRKRVDNRLRTTYREDTDWVFKSVLVRIVAFCCASRHQIWWWLVV